MGIVNVTPDSFSDGGLYLDAEKAIAHGLVLASAGADILDVGGESTRPGADEVDADEERRRTEPVVQYSGERWKRRIDRYVEGRVLPRPPWMPARPIVNDVTALRGDPEMAALCADRNCEVVLMHMLGTPRTMQEDPRYDDVVADVKSFLAERVQTAIDAGVDEERVWIDPGIGFGKTVEHNLELLRRLGEVRDLGPPILVGTSRKRFLGSITGRRRMNASAAASRRTCWRSPQGADAFRVHDVAETRQALQVAEALLGNAGWGVDERFATPAADAEDADAWTSASPPSPRTSR